MPINILSPYALPKSATDLPGLASAEDMDATFLKKAYDTAIAEFSFRPIDCRIVGQYFSQVKRPEYAGFMSKAFLRNPTQNAHNPTRLKFTNSLNIVITYSTPSYPYTENLLFADIYLDENGKPTLPEATYKSLHGGHYGSYGKYTADEVMAEFAKDNEYCTTVRLK